MKARVKYSNGWCLIFSQSGLAPQLFLEWMAKFRAGRNWIHKVNTLNGDSFSIRLNLPETEIKECAEYINLNQ